MRILISANRTIREVQKEFCEQYPFLKLTFYRRGTGTQGRARAHFSEAILLGQAGLLKDGELEFDNEMTVAELEGQFHEKFGLMVQVSRKSGTFWLETTMSDSWSLKKQNDHGREISTTPPASESSRFSDN